MAARLVTQVSAARLSTWSLVSRRALSTGAALSAKSQPTTDPVKQLFVDKIKVCYCHVCVQYSYMWLQLIILSIN